MLTVKNQTLQNDWICIANKTQTIQINDILTLINERLHKQDLFHVPPFIAGGQLGIILFLINNQSNNRNHKKQTSHIDQLWDTSTKLIEHYDYTPSLYSGLTGVARRSVGRTGADGNPSTTAIFS